MNSEEVFATAAGKPRKQLSARVGLHRLWLSRAEDLWYQGGGAGDDRSFGFAGRPSGGSRRLASVADLSVGWPPSARISFEWYLAKAWRGPVIERIFGGGGGSLMYLETSVTR